MHRDVTPSNAGPLSRRSLLKGAGQLGMVLAGAHVLGACSSNGGQHGGARQMVTSTGGGTPVQGGTLTIGTIGGGAAETLNPVSSATASGYLRNRQLFESLFRIGSDLTTIEPVLAESAERNADASVWTLRLRKGVQWHDGSPLTAEDVIFSFNFWAQPFSLLAGTAQLINLKGLKKLDDRTIEVPLARSNAQWPSTLAFSPIVKAGTDAAGFNTNPIGTGPFKFKSFSSRGSTFTANTNYWQTGRPHLDQVVFDTSFTDEAARLNALLSGQIDLMPASPFTATRQQLSTSDLVVLGSPSLLTYPFVMRIQDGPFADARVRQAMKLLVDRQALIDGAFSGFGTVAHDLFGSGLPYYADDLTVTRDVDQAKSLLRQAGAQDATFTLSTAPFASGVVEAGTLFAQQAQAAGVNMKIKQESAASYYTPSGGFLQSPLRQSYYLPNGSLHTYYSVFLSSTSTANETFWGSQPGGDEALKLVDQAVAATDEGLAKELWHQVQVQQSEQGGFLMFGNTHSINLVSPTVKGLVESPVGSLDDGHLMDAWITKA